MKEKIEKTVERPEDHPMYNIWMIEERIAREEIKSYRMCYFYHYGHDLQYP
jgi:hypothetical protein